MIRTYRTGGPSGALHSLEESADLFVVRTIKTHDCVSVIKSCAHQAGQAFEVVDEYPEVAVMVGRISKQQMSTVAAFKQAIRNLQDPRIRFIGSVLVESSTGVYQLYTGNLYIEFQAGTSKRRMLATMAAFGLITKRPLPFCSTAFFAEFPQVDKRVIFDVIDQVLQQPEVRLAQPEMVVKRRAFGNPTPFKDVPRRDEWVARRIGLFDAWKDTRGRGATICVIDDGLEIGHHAFHPPHRLSTVDLFKEGDGEHVHAREGHGTAVASVACADDPVAIGVAPEARLISCRSLGLGSVVEAEAIYQAVERGADVINCSWGPSDGNIDTPLDDLRKHPIPDHTRTAIEYAARNGRDGKGCLIVFAAGNGNEPILGDGYASHPDVLAVGAINRNDARSRYSDHGPELFCCFPSSELMHDGNTWKTAYGLLVADRLGNSGYDAGDYYSRFGGTSAAAPGLAGVAALVLSVAPHLNRQQLIDILRQSCERIGNPSDYSGGTSREFGHGLIRPDRAVALAKNQNVKHHLIMEKQRLALHIGVDRYAPVMRVNNLAGCANDARALFNLSSQSGYTGFTFDGSPAQQHGAPAVLLNEDATRDTILSAFEALVQQAQPGDDVLVTFAGHGGYIADESGDEQDGLDETLLAHDKLIIDDEIRHWHGRFREDVNLIWLVDCCHSGTNARAAGAYLAPTYERDGYMERQVDTALATAAFQRDAGEYRAAAERMAHAPVSDAANIVTLAACQDDQTAKEFAGRGRFTQHIEDVVRRHPQISSVDAQAEIIRLIANNQLPKMEFLGDGAAHFQQAPLWDFRAVRGDEQAALPSLPKSEIVVESGISSDCDGIVVETASKRIRLKSGERSGEAFILPQNGLVPTQSRNGRNPWDEAYELLANLEDPADVAFIEPNISYPVYAPESDNQNERGPTEFLDTYPAPNEENSDVPFIWQLDDRHSQLRSAFHELCGTDDFDPNNADLYPRVAHIDTGVYLNHPSLPANFNENLSRTFDGKRRLKSIEDEVGERAEEQGHGHGTVSILAGEKVMHTLPNAPFKGYYGAFPFAEVVSLKISPTVVLVKGKQFARAIDYIIKDLKADVVTMSMGGAPSRTMVKAINKAYEAGIVVVCAAGNSWTQSIKRASPKRMVYPGRFNRTIGVTGATVEKTPYLIAAQMFKDGDLDRAPGSPYQQTCYGPAEDMGSVIAAFSPNGQWASMEVVNGQRVYSYDGTGGGTSMATPQVAAAAALFIHKYRKELDQASRGAPWKKAEIVRQALFQSADKSYTEFQHVFGNGLLRAKDALHVDFNGIAANVSKAEKDRINWLPFDDTIALLIEERSQGVHEARIYKEMIQTEVFQLRATQPEFEEFGHDATLKDMAQTIVESPAASDALKRLVLARYDVKAPVAGTRSSGDGKNGFLSHHVATESGNLHLHAGGAAFHMSTIDEGEAMEAAGGQWLASFSVEMVASEHALRSGEGSGLFLDPSALRDDVVTLVETTVDGEKQLEWMMPGTAPEDTRSGSASWDNASSIRLDETASNERGLGKKIKRFFVRVFRTVTNEPLEGEAGLNIARISGDGTPEFHHISDQTEWVSALKEQERVFVFLHGAFSTPTGSFEDLFESKERWNRFSRGAKTGDYILAFNMSTIRTSIKKNADDLHAALGKLGVLRKTHVVAFAQGCLVARLAFKQSEVKMALIAGPHLGSPLSDPALYKKWIDRVATVTGFFGAPGKVIQKCLSVAGMLAKRTIKNAKGLADMAPDSKVIAALQDIALTEDHLLIAANFEANRFLKRLWDNAIDLVAFEGKANDAVVVMKSAKAGHSTDSPWHVFEVPGTDTNHFGYLANEAVVDQMIKHLK